MATKWIWLAAAVFAIAVPAALYAKAKFEPKVYPATANASGTVYDFELKSLNGKPMPMSAYKGQAVLLVNTASLCGFTPQYDGLEKLQKTYSPRGFTVIGVPSGDFMGQEYDDPNKIAEFCRTQYGVNFPLGAKSHVKGKDAAPIFKWAAKSTNSEPQWNFHKYLIGRDGKVIAAYTSKITPESAQLTGDIEKALGN